MTNLEEKKYCNGCEQNKLPNEFHVKKCNKDGLEYRCKVCTNESIRNNRAKNNNINTKKYERTLKGKLVRTYRNMMSRVKGILKAKAHLYEGLDIIDKEAFYHWSLNDYHYLKLFEAWVNSDYDLKLSPTVDRKNPKLGYVAGNMRWVTFSFNCSNTTRNG